MSDLDEQVIFFFFCFCETAVVGSGVVLLVVMGVEQLRNHEGCVLVTSPAAKSVRGQQRGLSHPHT